MIKNERQYRITKAESANIEAAIRELEEKPADPNLDPRFAKAEIDALRSQLEDLREDVEHYERLQAGNAKSPRVASVQDIPRVLIEGRIRAGLTHEDLAERAGLKAQQIQRYEATDYASASLSRVAEIANILGVDLGDARPAIGDFRLSGMMRRLKAAGLPLEFVTGRILPKQFAFRRAADGNDDLALEGAQAIERIYGWHPGVLLGTEFLDISRVAASQARFKVPARSNGLQLGAYVVYAHYLALLVLQTTKSLHSASLSTDPTQVRSKILGEFGSLSFESVLRFVWASGIPVLALNDPGSFHGACWRHSGRNVIVLKQQTRSSARWVFDLLHEYFHAAANPNLEEHPVVEEAETSESRRNSPEEIAASKFAGNVMLDTRAEALAELCVTKAKNSVERLKNAVKEIAKQENVDQGALANYLAFRLSRQGINWWAAATNLQSPPVPMHCTPREMLLRNADLTGLNPIDRNLLLRSLEPQVVAFSGQRASGKSTISTEVAKALNWKLASFGQYLRAKAKQQGVSESTENLQELGAAMVQEPDQFCDAVLAFSGWQSGEPLVIEGIRHQEIMESLRRRVAPLEVRLVYLDVDEEERKRRLEKREQSTPDRTWAVESHSTEKQVKHILPQQADLRISTQETEEVVVHRIVEWVQSGNTSQSGC
jgi:cytidylate kinase/transcriptional regulator with XRE-family HTH domain/Zn-dependent peptidase ImmA (M78 family)